MFFHKPLDLGGGNSNIFYFQPEPWGNDPIWRAYFSEGLKSPTRKDFVSNFYHFSRSKRQVVLECSTWKARMPTKKVLPIFCDRKMQTDQPAKQVIWFFGGLKKSGSPEIQVRSPWRIIWLLVIQRLTGKSVSRWQWCLQKQNIAKFQEQPFLVEFLNTWFFSCLHCIPAAFALTLKCTLRIHDEHAGDLAQAVCVDSPFDYPARHGPCNEGNVPQCGGLWTLLPLLQSDHR